MIVDLFVVWFICMIIGIMLAFVSNKIGNESNSNIMWYCGLFIIGWSIGQLLSLIR